MWSSSGGVRGTWQSVGDILLHFAMSIDVVNTIFGKG
jgi:hypothetical protein